MLPEGVAVGQEGRKKMGTTGKVAIAGQGPCSDDPSGDWYSSKEKQEKDEKA